ncbi:hypothetical protein BDR07DRAFT_1378903 [Suillus spraguei]|nr:hypothetical protein BDR07DRAFT_1378903 [Suillus spraguei]
MVMDEPMKAMEQELGAGFQFGISMLWTCQAQMLGNSAFKMCSIIAGEHSSSPIVYIIDNGSSCSFEKSIIERLTVVVTTSFSATLMAPSVAHLDSIADEDRLREDSDDDNDDNDIDDEFPDATSDIGDDVKKIMQEVQEIGVDDIINDMHTLAIAMEDGEDFTQELANISSDEELDDQYDEVPCISGPPVEVVTNTLPVATMGAKTEALGSCLEGRRGTWNDIIDDMHTLAIATEDGEDFTKELANTEAPSPCPEGRRGTQIHSKTKPYVPPPSPPTKHIKQPVQTLASKPKYDELQRLRNFDIDVSKIVGRMVNCRMFPAGGQEAMINNFTPPFNANKTLAANNLNHHDVLQNIGCAYLKEYDVIVFPNIILTHAELCAVRSLANQCGPIGHIREPVDSCKCNLCDYSWAATRTLAHFIKHWSLYHKASCDTPTQKRFVKVKIQTFNHDQSQHLYFPVREEVSRKKVSQSIREVDGTSILAAQLQQLAPTGQATHKLATKAVLPFFQQIGTADHVLPYKESVLSELVALPVKGEKLLKKLQRVIIWRFEELCKQVSGANLANRQWLVTPRSDSVHLLSSTLALSMHQKKYGYFASFFDAY